MEKPHTVWQMSNVGFVGPHTATASPSKLSLQIWFCGEIVGTVKGGSGDIAKMLKCGPVEMLHGRD